MLKVTFIRNHLIERKSDERLREETKNRRETQRGGRIKREKERRRHPRSASLKFRPIRGFPFSIAKFSSAPWARWARPSPTLWELFRNLYTCPFEPPPTCIYIYIYTRGVRRRIRLDWLRGRIFWNSRIRSEMSRGFPNHGPFYWLYRGVGNWRGREMADRKRHVAGMLIRYRANYK